MPSDEQIEAGARAICLVERPNTMSPMAWKVYIPAAKAALEAASSAQAPDGWKLVPIEPTDEMLEAASVHSTVLTQYMAMVEYAPQPPAAGKQ